MVEDQALQSPTPEAGKDSGPILRLIVGSRLRVSHAGLDVCRRRLNVRGSWLDIRGSGLRVGSLFIVGARLNGLVIRRPQRGSVLTIQFEGDIPQLPIAADLDWEL